LNSETLNITENAEKQCRPIVRQNDFGMWEALLELIFGGVAS